jgi:hypothetical protein
MIPIGELKHSIEQLNRFVESVDLWFEIVMQFPTHIFCSLQAFVRLELMRSEKTITNWYEVQRNLFTEAVREYILNNPTTAGVY